ncbi:ribosome biogenesis GTPase YqeH [Ureaplasma ceti]|uniref:Ribosome biogenesis GTPase YqeH n=1 Tax=Ureaplasma ceti TaxID=3119530 RepID=A0ABP9U8Q1_9BACT
MKSYNVKCVGCGAYLNDDPKKTGYVAKFEENKTKYCQRCFRLINYGEIDNSNLDVGQIVQQIKEIDLDKAAHIFHVVDVLDLNDTVLTQFLDHQDKLTFVVNKVDCLPKRLNSQLTAQMIEKTIQSFGFRKPIILFTSANNKSSIKRLYNEVEKVQKKKMKAIFVGCTNVGKSSLINRMCELNEVKPELTISPYVNTTILLQKVKIGRCEIIDTPGLPMDQNILNYVGRAEVKKLTNFKNTRPKNYFINPEQSLMIEGLGFIDYLEGERATFTFYVSNEVTVRRTKFDKIDKIFYKRNELADIQVHYSDEPTFVTHTFELDPTRKHNLCISGIGLITLNRGIKKITVTMDQRVGVSVAKYAII